MLEKEDRDILKTLVELLPRMTKLQRIQFAAFGEGMALMKKREEDENELEATVPAGGKGA